MSKVIDRSITEVADRVFIDHERTRESVLKLIEDMSQDKSLSNDERHNRIEIIIQAMK
tara:strand:- start:133 stop:306 length:174 start_codon:yes stop_codon:yes gene_type:complete